MESNNKGNLQLQSASQSSLANEGTAEAAANVSFDDNACVVCFKNVEIYSVGECDHPVCYECSTRMRVLCKQNECPICRQVLFKVIFTYDKLPYRELEAKNRSEYYSKKYRIGFYTYKIQQAFFNLLDHQCPKCNAPPYRDFTGLKNHVRKEHELHYCDICAEHLKIFTFERRCYTQAELGLHRVKGDIDNKSHRGHPLCEYCSCRYLDRDELFRHLRRDHYFCHFCDADGYNDFYRDYDALAEHFRQDHFLCEEGKCATEQFTGAFRSEIDYKAHVANVHGKSLNKQQVKQARTLQLEITLGRRGRPGQAEPGVANVRSRGNDEINDEYQEISLTQSQNNPRAVTIDAHNEQDFPSLGGASGPSVSLVRPAIITNRNRGIAGLARTKENFPALGGGEVGASVGTQQQRPAAPISKILKHPPTTATGAVARTTSAAAKTNNNSNGAGMIIHVSNRPVSSGNNIKSTSNLDFPALPSANSKKYVARNGNEHANMLPSCHVRDANGSTKQHITQDDCSSVMNSNTFQQAGKSKKNGSISSRLVDEDMLPSGASIPMDNVSAKHRILVDDYVSVANPSVFQKLQLVKKEEEDTKARKAATEMSAPKLTTHDFPTLGAPSAGNSGTSNNKTNLWVKNTAMEKKQREQENRKAKVAPAPILSKQTKPPTASTANSLHNNNSAEFASGGTSKKDKKTKDNKKPTATDLTTKSANNNKEKEKNNNNENKPESGNLNKNPTTSATSAPHGNDSNMLVTHPPPGFSKVSKNSTSNVIKPPPGFQSSVIVNSVAKSPNNLTFTSSLGESYSIVPTHSYMQPPECITRNQKLVGHFKETLRSAEALEEFRHISQRFREGAYKAPAYYEHCQAALGDKFDKVFPELLALLPDISKQQALFLVHSQRLKNLSAEQLKKLPSLDVCATCKQVLLKSDLENHKKMHSLKENFPALSSSNVSKGTSGNSK